MAPFWMWFSGVFLMELTFESVFFFLIWEAFLILRSLVPLGCLKSFPPLRAK